MAKPKVELQTHMEDEHLEVAGLLEALDKWADARQAAMERSGMIRKLTDAKAVIAALLPDDGADHQWRVGKYIIRITQHENKLIEFERKAGRSITIK